MKEKRTLLGFTYVPSTLSINDGGPIWLPDSFLFDSEEKRQKHILSWGIKVPYVCIGLRDNSTYNTEAEEYCFINHPDNRGVKIGREVGIV